MKEGGGQQGRCSYVGQEETDRKLSITIIEVKRDGRYEGRCVRNGFVQNTVLTMNRKRKLEPDVD